MMEKRFVHRATLALGVMLSLILLLGGESKSASSRQNIYMPQTPDSTIIGGINLTGPSTGVVNTVLPFTATVTVLQQSLIFPIRYTWEATEQQPTTHPYGTTTDILNFSWSLIGPKTVTVTATDISGASIYATHQLIIRSAAYFIYQPLILKEYTPPPVCWYPVTGAAISGPQTGEINKTYNFNAMTTPTNATPPLTYVWSPAPLSGQGTASASYRWTTTGNQTVGVSVSNCGGTVSASYNIVLEEPRPDVASVLTPFDANTHDLSGPSSWATNYGKMPEIIVASNGSALYVLAQDYDDNTPWNAVLLHIVSGASDYRLTQVFTDLPMLDRVMGLALDASGNIYYATGVNESAVVDPYYPPPNTYRSDIVRIIKLNPAGAVQFNIDLDIARHDFDPNAEMIINPMTFGSSRLAVGGNEIALVHSINTGPDWNIEGRRHQKALSTRLDATSGAIIRTNSVWVSHSFDQRLLYDDAGIIEHHLGDAYPRYIVFARNHTSYPLFHIKGALGENNTRTRLGNVALIENDPAYTYIALFATENSAATGSTIDGPRNLAIVRVKDSDNSIDPSLPDTLTVTSSSQQYTNRLRWLTQYSASSNLHAERPKLVGIGNDQYIVLWEEWRYTGAYSDTFNGVYGMVINAQGDILRATSLLTTQHHLHRGDDAFLLNQHAAWMTGSAAQRQLHLHLVDAFLNYELVTLQ